MNRTLLAAVFLSTLILGGCDISQPPETVVVYTSVDRIFAEPVLMEAQDRLGIKVVGVYDTEETKSTGLVNRLIARKDNPDGDIFWSGDPARAALLKTKGITTAYDSLAAQKIAENYKDVDRHWIGFSARTRVLLVNTDLVPPGQEPKTILELTDAKWKDRVAIANPLFGTTSFHMAALSEKWGKDRLFGWLNDLRGNGVRVLTSNGEVKRQVAAGTVAIGLSDSDDAAEAIEDGQPIRAVLLDQAVGDGDPLGTLVMPNTVSLVKGGPNPLGAQRVYDYLLSAETQRQLAKSCAQAPLSAGITVPDKVISLDNVRAMQIDYAACAEELEVIMPLLKDWVDGG